MKLALFLSTLIFTCLTSAAETVEVVGLKMEISINEKLVSQPYVATVIGENFMIQQESSDGSGLTIKGEVYNCGDGTYTVHMNYSYSGEFSHVPMQGHASVTTSKNNETSIIITDSVNGMNDKISLKFTIIDPR